MRRSAYTIAVLTMGLIALATQGFQCGSENITSGKLYYGQYENSRDTTRLNMALAAFQNEVKTRPNSAEGWYWIGLVYGVKKDFTRLNEAWNNSLRVSNQMKPDIDKNRPYFWGQAFNGGIAAMQKARATGKASYYADALALLRNAVSLQPDSSAKYNANLTIAACLVDQKKWDEALPALRTAIDKENSPEAYRILGNYYMNRGQEHRTKFQEANAEALALKTKEAKLRKGITAREVTDLLGDPAAKKTLGKKSEEWSFEKGIVARIDDGRLSSFSYAAGKEPRIDSTEMRAAAVEYEEALKVLKQGTAAHPQNDALREASINAYINLNRVQEAIEPLKAQIARNPNDKQLHYVYGVILLNLKRYDESIAEFETALKIDPNYEEAMFNMGRAYVNQGVEMRDKAMAEAADPAQMNKDYLKKFEAALPHIEKYLGMKPNDADSWELAGRIYLSLGKGDKATEAFAKADQLRKGGK